MGSQDRVLLELEHLAFSRITDYRVDALTGEITLTEDAPAHAMSVVSKVKRNVSHRAFGANKIDEIEVEIALWDSPPL